MTGSNKVVEFELEDIVLGRGMHDDASDGMCLLEAASYIAGEPFSDHPQCVDPIIGSYGRRLNDLLPNDERQQLKPYLQDMLKTAGDGKSEQRRWVLADWALRIALPRWLHVAERHQDALTFEQLVPITDAASYAAARKATLALYPAPYEARRLAWESLRTKVRHAVRAEFTKAGVKPVAAVAAVAAEVAEVAAAAVAADAATAAAAEAAAAAAVAAAAAEAAAAAAVAVAAAEAAAVAEADFVNYGPSYWAFRDQVRDAVRAKLDALDPAPGSFAEARLLSRQEGIALLGRLIDPDAV